MTADPTPATGADQGGALTEAEREVLPMRMSDLRKVVTEALAEAATSEMDDRTREEWVAIRVAASPWLAARVAAERERIAQAIEWSPWEQASTERPPAAGDEAVWMAGVDAGCRFAARIVRKGGDRG